MSPRTNGLQLRSRISRETSRASRKPTSDDIDAFVRDNPGCCSIESTEPFAGWVHLVFELKPHRISPSQPNDVAYDSLVFVNECGAKTSAFGSPITLDAMRMTRQAQQGS